MDGKTSLPMTFSVGVAESAHIAGGLHGYTKRRAPNCDRRRGRHVRPIVGVRRSTEVGR